VSRPTELASLRADLGERWLIFYDAWRVCLTARLRDDATVVIRADEPVDLRRKIARREKGLDRAREQDLDTQVSPPPYIRPYIDARPPRTGALPVIERGSP
jgi:hypothetical protein